LGKKKISQKNRLCDALRQRERRLLGDAVAEGSIIREFSKDDKKQSVKEFSFTDCFCMERYN
jgi:hypothetical protein